MTQVIDAPVARSTPRHQAPGWSAVEHLAGLGAPALTLSYLVHGTGGRDLQPLWVTVAVAGSAAMVLRVWHDARWILALSAWTIAASFVVALVHSPGPADPLGQLYRWPAPGGYTVAVLLLLICRAYATDRRRLRALALVLAAATTLQFAWAFTPWWGGGTPLTAMIGTIYWHNQYAAFLYPGTVLGFQLALGNLRPWRFLGWVATALGVAGTVYSTSRAELALLLASLAVVAVAALRGPGRRSMLVRAVGLSASAAVVVLLMCNPPLVATSHSPFAAEQQRTAGQSLGANGGYRVEFWREAIAVGGHHPVAGAGFGELARAKQGLVPASYPSSPLAHNGFLQAFADGGLLLGLPLVVAGLALAIGAVRRLPDALRRRDLLGTAAIVALGGVLAHSLVDFDWSYPAVFGVGAVTAALATARVSN